jgi:tripartite ATP-independent transporter DctM subunit
MIPTALVTLLLLLALAVPVAASLGVLGLLLGEIYAFLPVHRAIGEIAWKVMNNTLLVSIPLFVLLGEIMLRSGMAQRMYAALGHWLTWLPGGLMHSNIGACTMFSAISGSSVATAATVGTVAIAEGRNQGYNDRLFLGTLAAGGTLGILIPPSINLIVYGVLTDTSIPKLYLAGIVPGLILAGLFMLTVILICRLRPEWGGTRRNSTWQDRIRSLPALLPPLVIFLVVIGSIYAGWATPTESAALGVLAALGLTLVHRDNRLNLASLRQAVEGTVQTSAMILAILVAAYFLNFVMASIGLTRQVNAFVTTLGLSPFETLMLIVLFYLILGMFMETLSMMITTVPIITPIVVGLGYDPIWFGILIMLLIETAMITPPVGINLFVVQGVRGQGQLHDVMLGALPFVLTLLVMIGVLIAMPGLALWLPTL